MRLCMCVFCYQLKIHLGNMIFGKRSDLWKLPNMADIIRIRMIFTFTHETRYGHFESSIFLFVLSHFPSIASSIFILFLLLNTIWNKTEPKLSVNQLYNQIESGRGSRKLPKMYDFLKMQFFSFFFFSFFFFFLLLFFLFSFPPFFSPSYTWNSFFSPAPSLTRRFWPTSDDLLRGMDFMGVLY